MPKLSARHDEPDGLAEHHNSHSMHVQTQTSAAYGEYDDRRYDASVDCNAPKKTTTSQSGNRPESNRKRSGDGVDRSECLIDLKNRRNNDVPLWSGCRGVLDHLLHDVWDDKTTHRRCNQNRNRAYSKNNHGGKG